MGHRSFIPRNLSLSPQADKKYHTQVSQVGEKKKAPPSLPCFLPPTNTHAATVSSGARAGQHALRPLHPHRPPIERPHFMTRAARAASRKANAGGGGGGGAKREVEAKVGGAPPRRPAPGAPAREPRAPRLRVDGRAVTGRAGGWAHTAVAGGRVAGASAATAARRGGGSPSAHCSTAARHSREQDDHPAPTLQLHQAQVGEVAEEEQAVEADVVGEGPAELPPPPLVPLTGLRPRKATRWPLVM